LLANKPCLHLFLDSVRAFKQRNKLGQFAETTPEDEEAKKEKERQEQEEAEAIPVGSRCEIRIGGNTKRGEVMYVGMYYSPVHSSMYLHFNANQLCHVFNTEYNIHSMGYLH